LSWDAECEAMKVVEGWSPATASTIGCLQTVQIVYLLNLLKSRRGI
jgi:hypothetical protein